MYIYGGMNHEDQLLGDLCAFKFTGTLSHSSIVSESVFCSGVNETNLAALFYNVIERRWITIGATEAASARTEHAMCNVGDRIYIFGGQLDLNANEDSGLIHVLETCMFNSLSL